MNTKEKNQTTAMLAGLKKFNRKWQNLNGFNKNVSYRYFTDISKIVSCDNITAK